jgi:hypothetical protein
MVGISIQVTSPLSGTEQRLLQRRSFSGARLQRVRRSRFGHRRGLDCNRLRGRHGSRLFSQNQVGRQQGKHQAQRSK